MAHPQRATAAGEGSFEEVCVPVRVASDDQVHAARLDARAQWMLSFIDGRSVLGHVLSISGLPLDEAREGVGELVVRGLVVLDTGGSESWSHSRP
jgi:hypothetical protein